MKNLKKISLFTMLASTVGIVYAIYTLKDLPDAFDFNLGEDEDDREI